MNDWSSGYFIKVERAYLHICISRKGDNIYHLLEMIAYKHDW